ncbi:pentapeptide repeat-containing protein [Streptomyces sp. NPDC052015]|uniref:pentapeptide repeat-containing protein n=1 Tax=Streptomyces sp. NPDC052015 TaxID=3154755 RepID=UPI003441FBE2
MSNTDDASPHQASPERARKIELLSFIVTAVVALGGLGYSVYSIKQVNDELVISKEGQITDRYSAAVANLGDDAMDVRLGGLYALQRIMEDSTRDHPTIANILATYVRTHADEPVPEGEEIPADIQAALTMLARRDSSHDDDFRLDLHSAHLFGADLPGADLSNADLRGADLRGADLFGAFLFGADLRGADLRGADLTEANLADAELTSADLTDADLTGADLHETDLIAEGVTVKQVLSAHVRASTELPPSLAKDPSVQARIAEVERQAM